MHLTDGAVPLAETFYFLLRSAVGKVREEDARVSIIVVRVLRGRRVVGLRGDSVSPRAECRSDSRSNGLEIHKETSHDLV